MGTNKEKKQKRRVYTQRAQKRETAFLGLRLPVKTIRALDKYARKWKCGTANKTAALLIDEGIGFFEGISGRTKKQNNKGRFDHAD